MSEEYGEVIAQRPEGIDVIISEELKPERHVTATVVMFHKEKGMFTITYKDRPTEFISSDNASVRFPEMEEGEKTE